MAKLIAVNFEVYGTVQGVFFRKYTKEQAKNLDLKGWCMNTNQGTVTGHLEGPENKVQEMKYWLQNTGSPQSRIDKVIFRDEAELSQIKLKAFEIKK